MRLAVSISPRRVLLALAVALFPLYVFPSGGVQPSHLVFLMLAMLALGRMRMPGQPWLILLAVLAVYSLLVELVAGVAADEMKHVINAAFFFFNFLLMIGVYTTVRRYGVRALKYGVIVAAAIAFIFVYTGGVSLQELGPGGRPTGTFNNPNQLGFFSVCILSLAYLCYLEEEMSFPVMVAILCAAVFLSIASLSKAAMIASFLVLAFALRPRHGQAAVVMWIVLAILGVGGVLYLVSTGYFDQFYFYRRIINMAQESDSSLESRGYFAFLDGSLFEIIFGMGSPKVFEIVGHEVHSTFASVWNTYGIVGMMIFLPIFIIWFRTLVRAYGLIGMTVIVAPAMLYGITHNGTRFSIFWLLLAATMATAHRKLGHFSQARPSPAPGDTP